MHGCDFDVEYLDDRGQVFEVPVFSVHVEQRAQEGLNGLREFFWFVGFDAEEELEVLGVGEGEACGEESLSFFVVGSEFECESGAGVFCEFVSDFEVDEFRNAFFAG